MAKSKDDTVFVYEGYEGTDWQPGNNEGGMYYLYGQCAAANLESVQKQFGDLLKDEIAKSMKAEACYGKIFHEKNYFKMVFGFNHETRMSDFHDAIFNAWWDTAYAQQFKLKLFYYNDVYTASDFGCTYYIQLANNDNEETESFNFQVGDYDDVNEVHYSRLAAVEKYIEYRLLKESGNKEDAAKAKEEWEKEVKAAEETKKAERKKDSNETEKTEWLEKIKKDYKNFKKVPKELITEDFCLAAVQLKGKLFGSPLQFVPKELKTKALCLAAVKNKAGALANVPKALLTEDICLAAVQADRNEYVLKYVPEALQTEALCIVAMRNNGRWLQYLPETHKTEAVCVAAVKQDKDAVQWVPDALKAKVQAAVK